MTEKLYYSNPYLKETEATVTAVTENGFLLDKSIFYPECGGQRGDSGRFGRFRIVTTVKDAEGNPLHVTDGELPSVGDRCMLTLDWRERFFGMQEHTAQHLLSSVLYNSFGIGTVAVHHGSDEITIETDRSCIARNILLEAEEEAVRLIGENRKVWIQDMTREEAEGLGMRRSIKVDDEIVKVVFIENQDAVACGGVHLSSLGQIGELAFVGEDSVRSHCRTIWRVGEKARELRRENAASVAEAGALLSSDRKTLVRGVEHLVEENRELKRHVKALEKTVSEAEFRSHSENPVVYSASGSLDSLVEIACAEKERKVFVIGAGNTFMFVGSADEFGILKRELQLRGGGKAPLFRGTFTKTPDEMVSSVKSLLCSLQDKLCSLHCISDV